MSFRIPPRPLASWTAALAIATLTVPPGKLMAHDSPPAAAAASSAESNKTLIRDAFERWRLGTGGVFDLLATDAQWTIVGTSQAAGVYHSRDEFLKKVIQPFDARMARPLSPSVRNIYADGDTVVVLFDAKTLANDGQPYANTYAWFLRMKNRHIVEATAFFDSKTFDAMWTRVRPEPTGHP